MNEVFQYFGSSFVIMVLSLKQKKIFSKTTSESWPNEQSAISLLPSVHGGKSSPSWAARDPFHHNDQLATA